MSATGKKGKKGKGTAMSLQTFLWNNDVPAGTTQVAKSIRNVDGEDSDDGGIMHTVVCQLPTAPRSSRIFEDNSIPHKPPFIAYITNLPFDVKESDISEYFIANNVKSVRLPREDGETGRVRGFGYVEFETRDDLIQSLGIRDPTIKGRRIRIDLSNENEQNGRQRGPKRGYDPAGSSSEGRDSTNWRRDNNNTKRESYNFGAERHFRDEKFATEEDNSPGSWRARSQTSFTISSSVEQLHHKDQDDHNLEKNNTLERPRLMLKPRTLPLPQLEVSVQATESKMNDLNSSKVSGTPAEKVFGSAKPVDTMARDLEIEERLTNVRRQDNLRTQVETITNGLDELNVVKDEKVKRPNWRQQTDNVESWKNQDRRNIRTDTRSEYSKDNRKKYQDKTEGSDSQKTKDGKVKDSMKIKREPKVDYQGGKNVRSQNESAVTTASVNKYSGLEGDSD